MKGRFIPNSFSSLTTWLCYINNLHKKSINLGLERIFRIAIDLDLLRPAKYVLTVGGTNGKGTTCCLLENILIDSGIKVGVYTSPHLIRYTERVRIQGKELSESDHTKAMSIIEFARGTTLLTYFEFGTLSALYLFKQAFLEIVILEVGLGGRLDSTNIIDSDISVITSIDFDHTDCLGKDRSSIAREKSGIFRRGKIAVIGEYNRPYDIDLKAYECGAIMFARIRDWNFQKKEEEWNWWNQDYMLQALPIPSIPIDNAATALAVIRCLPFNISESIIRKNIFCTVLQGRFQIVNQCPLVILDVAHNPHAANYLACRLKNKLQLLGEIRAVVGMRSDKDIFSTLRKSLLYNIVTRWYCASLEGFHAASAEQLASCLIGNNNIKKFENVLNAWNQAVSDSKSEDCILVFGSFQTVAVVIKQLRNSKNIIKMFSKFTC